MQKKYALSPAPRFSPRILSEFHRGLLEKGSRRLKNGVMKAPLFGLRLALVIAHENKNGGNGPTKRRTCLNSRHGRRRTIGNGTPFGISGVGCTS